MIWATEWEGGLLQLKDGHFIQVRAKNDTIDFRRIMTDDQGRQLVANGLGECHALDNNRQKPFFDGKFFTKFTGDSIRRTYGLSTRPTAIALPPRPSGRLREGELWFSTGKDIRCKTKDTEQIILPDTKDVSAMYRRIRLQRIWRCRPGPADRQPRTPHHRIRPLCTPL